MFILIPVYSRFFSPEEYGIIDLISTTLAFLTIIGMLQMEAAIGRFFYESSDENERRLNISTAFWTVFVVSIVCSLLLVIVSSDLMKLITGSDKYGNLLVIAAMILPVSNLYALSTQLPSDHYFSI